MVVITHQWQKFYAGLGNPCYQKSPLANNEKNVLFILAHHLYTNLFHNIWTSGISLKYVSMSVGFNP